MASRYGTNALSRARRRAAQRRRLIIGVAAAAAVLVAALVILLLPKGGRSDATVNAVAPVQPTAAPEADLPTETVEALPADTPQPTPEPTAAPTAEPLTDRALTRPTPTAPGFAPVFSNANTQEKIIAITVDDCYQAENLQQIVDKAIEVGGKLTIFPIGQNAMRERQAQILKYAWENGFELENHTFTHNGLYAISDEEMAAEVYKQQLVLSYMLGVEYQPHFLRPKGGDARKDQRMQNYALQLGYYGIAHWSASGAADDATIAKNLKPGAIFLFHTTDRDLDKLLRFIPWVAEKGYQMVTLNEMFGYPANETAELPATPIKEREIPALQPYQVVYSPLKKTTYSWQAYLFQQKLIELGYLTGEPDGVYGADCEKAVKAYQKDHGMEQTGVADADLVRALLEGGA